MKIALVHPPEPAKSIASEVMQHPINLAQLAAYLMRNGVVCEIWDYKVRDYSEADFLKNLERFAPDVLGIGAVTPLINSGAKLAKFAKSRFPAMLTVLGGPHLSAIPEKTLRDYPMFDIGVIGEGELTLQEVVDQLGSGQPLTDIPGTVFRDGDNVLLGPERALIRNLDDLPYPARELIDFSLYRGSSSPGLSNRNMNITQLFTSRGCPAHCIFCASSVTHRHKMRMRSAQHVLGEVRECVERYGINHFTIDDDTFTYGRKRLMEICAGFRELGVTWDCDSRVDSIDEEMVRVMAESGCIKIAFGVESGSPRILELIDKGIKIPQIENAFRWAKQYGIETAAFLMIGAHPSETEKDLELSLSFMKRIAPDYLMCYCAVPYPGTRLHDMMDREGMIVSDDWDEYDIVRTRPVWHTEHHSAEDMIRHQQRLYRRYYLRPAYFWKTLKKIRSREQVRYLFETGFRFLRYIFSGKRVGSQTT